MIDSPAPELTHGLEWINCAPTTLSALRGSVVVVAFWSAGSAYSQNMLDDLRHIQKKFAGAVQVIAVHVPKFDAERDAQFVRKAAARLGATVRVAHDPSFIAWQHYGVTAWPTAFVIDPAGVVRDVIIGDRQREALERPVEKLIEDYDLDIVENQKPPLNPPDPEKPLAFPSGILITDHHLYVSDTGHHTVLECTREGRVMRRFGSGQAEFIDGPMQAASFRHPCGLALGRDILFVADPGNHALRRIRVIDGDVLTLAGNGRPGQPMDGIVGAGRNVSLDQPWSVAASEDRVYISLAGNNEIWAYEHAKKTLAHVAGSGALALSDGDGRGAAFAQPAGIALVHALLYVVDSAGSALRSLQTYSGKTQTLLGHGLFEFGDAIGARPEARLQYPMAVAKDPETAHVWILDTYNNCVRKLKLGGGVVAQFDISYKLNCPMAMTVSSGALWIANTHAHEILRVEMANGSTRRLPVGE